MSGFLAAALLVLGVVAALYSLLVVAVDAVKAVLDSRRRNDGAG